MYSPSNGEKKIEILKQDVNPITKSHPKFNTVANIAPKVLPTWYRKYRSSYKQFYSGQPFTENLRPDPFLESYRQSRKIEQQGERYVFTGPQSSYNTIDKVNMLLRDSTNPGTKIDRKTLDRAIEKTVDEFKNVNIRPVTYNDVLSSRQFLKNRRHDVGFSGIGFADKFELANNPAFRQYARRFDNSNAKATYKLFWKTETLKKNKAELVPRIIYGTNVEAEMMERQSFQPFVSSLKHRRWNTPSKIGISNQEFPRLYARHNFDKGWLGIAIDFSKQDRYMPQPIMDARKRVLTRIASLQGVDQRAINHIARSVDKTSSYYVVTPTGEVVELSSGHPSGLYLGAEGNTINHRIIHNYVDIKHGFTNLKKVDSQYGDDALRSLPPKNPLTRKYLSSRSKLFDTIKNDLGLQTTVDMWGEHPLNHHEPAFLRRKFINNPIGPGVIPKFDEDRVRNKWLIPHVSVKTAQDSFDRSLGYLMLCGGNKPLFDEIRSYMHHIGSRPDVNQPKLFNNLTYNNLIKNYYRPHGHIDPHSREYVDYETFAHVSHQGGFPMSVAIPSGEGKTWLKTNFPRLFADHDDFITGKNRREVDRLTVEAKRTNDWTAVNELNKSLVPRNLNKVLLTWSPQTSPDGYLFGGQFLLDHPTNIRENLGNRASLASSKRMNTFYYPDFTSRNKDILAMVPDTLFRRKFNPFVATNRFYLDESLPRSQERLHKVRSQHPMIKAGALSNMTTNATERSIEKQKEEKHFKTQKRSKTPRPTLGEFTKHEKALINEFKDENTFISSLSLPSPAMAIYYSEMGKDRFPSDIDGYRGFLRHVLGPTFHIFATDRPTEYNTMFKLWQEELETFPPREPQSSPRWQDYVYRENVLEDTLKAYVNSDPDLQHLMLQAGDVETNPGPIYKHLEQTMCHNIGVVQTWSLNDSDENLSYKAALLENLQKPIMRQTYAPKIAIEDDEETFEYPISHVVHKPDNDKLPLESALIGGHTRNWKLEQVWNVLVREFHEQGYIMANWTIEKCRSFRPSFIRKINTAETAAYRVIAGRKFAGRAQNPMRRAGLLASKHRSRLGNLYRHTVVQEEQPVYNPKVLKRVVERNSLKFVPAELPDRIFTVPTADHVHKEWEVNHTILSEMSCYVTYGERRTTTVPQGLCPNVRGILLPSTGVLKTEDFPPVLDTRKHSFRPFNYISCSFPGCQVRKYNFPTLKRINGQCEFTNSCRPGSALCAAHYDGLHTMELMKTYVHTTVLRCHIRGNVYKSFPVATHRSDKRGDAFLEEWRDMGIPYKKFTAERKKIADEHFSGNLECIGMVGLLPAKETSIQVPKILRDCDLLRGNDSLTFIVQSIFTNPVSRIEPDLPDATVSEIKALKILHNNYYSELTSVNPKTETLLPERELSVLEKTVPQVPLLNDRDRFAIEAMSKPSFANLIRQCSNSTEIAISVGRLQGVIPKDSFIGLICDRFEGNIDAFETFANDIEALEEEEEAEDDDYQSRRSDEEIEDDDSDDDDVSDCGSE